MILEVTETKQYITTEGYPRNYENDQHRSFNFVAPPGERIIAFFEDFRLERFMISSSSVSYKQQRGCAKKINFTTNSIPLL